MMQKIVMVDREEANVHVRVAGHVLKLSAKAEPAGTLDALFVGFEK